MVEKMKKYSFLIYYKTYNEFLESIKQAGVVHIVEKQKGVPEDATDLKEQLALDFAMKNVIKEFKRRLTMLKNVSVLPFDKEKNGINVIAEYEQLKSIEEQLATQRQILLREIDNMSVWGDFDLNLVKKLEEEGIKINFYSCRDREFQNEWIEKYDAVEVAKKGSFVYFITVSPIDVKEEPEAERMKISEKSLQQLKIALRENEKNTSDVHDKINEMSINHLNNLIEAQKHLHEKIDISKVHLQTEKIADEKLILLEGWVPEINENELIEACKSQDVLYIGGILPEKDDKSAPILLKNNKLARLYEPIGELYEMPNYHEFDLTPFFAPFFMFFFGLCLGDTGYGLLILIATLYARKKVKPSLKPMISLAATCGAAAVVCGMIGGTLFGIPLIKMDWAWLNVFKGIMLDDKKMFYFALIVGIVHILYGMIIRACGVVRRYGWAHSLERWGWLILLIGGGSWYILTNSNKMIFTPEITKYFIIFVLGISGLFIFLLNTPKRNPLINIGVGLWNSFNMVTSIIGDVLSYIRLFALGLCGSVMGLVFNDLAMKLSPDVPVIGHLVMLIILLVGHSINIFISGLGAFVHPLRLTFVEFYKNAGFEGGGKKYKPLKNQA